MVKRFNEEWIERIEDITDFVKQQSEYAKSPFGDLMVPREDVIKVKEEAIVANVGL